MPDRAIDPLNDSDRCPGCGGPLVVDGMPPAVSRADDAHRVCSPCGTREALLDWFSHAD